VYGLEAHGTGAAKPVPVEPPTTSNSIDVRVWAVSGRMTLRESGAAAGRSVPEASRSPSTIRGCTQTPPLATVEYTDIICIGVTATPCPMAAVGSWVADQVLAGGTIPGDSPGRPTPVALPYPNFCR